MHVSNTILHEHFTYAVISSLVSIELTVIPCHVNNDISGTLWSAPNQCSRKVVLGRSKYTGKFQSTYIPVIFKTTSVMAHCYQNIKHFVTKSSTERQNSFTITNGVKQMIG